MAWGKGGAYGSAWRKLRNQVLAEEPICQSCMVRLSVECDHIKPKAKGGTDDRGNLQALCKPCHAEKTARESAEAKGHAYRPRQTFGVDGWPVS